MTATRPDRRSTDQVPAGGSSAGRPAGALAVAAAAVGLAGPLAAGALGSLWVGFLAFARLDVAAFLTAAMTFGYLDRAVSLQTGTPPILIPFAVLLALTFVLRLPRDEQASRRIAPAACLIAAYGVIVLASSLGARSPELASAGVRTYLENAVLAIALLVLFARARSVGPALWAIVAAGLVVGLVNVVQSITGGYGQTWFSLAIPLVGYIGDGSTDYRLGGPVGDPNFFAQLLVAGLPIAIERFLHERRAALRIVALASACFSAVAILFTYSRGGLMAMVVVAVLVVVRFRLTRVVPVVLVLLTAGAAVLVPREDLVALSDRIGTVATAVPAIVFDGRPEDSSLRGRASEVKVGIEIFRDHPLLGAGIGNYEAHYLDYSERLQLDTRRVDRSAHSTPVEVAAETGALGLAAWGALAFGALAVANRADRTARLRGEWERAAQAAAIRIGLIGYLVSAVFLHTSYWRTFWLFVALCFSLRTDSGEASSP